MQDKFRLYRRPNGMLYAEECGTRHRQSLQTKNEAEARRLIAAKNPSCESACVQHGDGQGVSEGSRPAALRAHLDDRFGCRSTNL
jgi:hypothetical protein